MANQCGDMAYLKFEYIIEMQGEFAKLFSGSSLIKSIENKSNCTINLTRRILNRQIENQPWTKYHILEITSNNERNVKICNQLLDRAYPMYRNRKLYKKRSNVSLFTKEFHPDNTDLYYPTQRTGVLLAQHCNLELNNLFSIENRANDSYHTPWKITNLEMRGCYLPQHYQTFDSIRNYYPDIINFKDDMHPASFNKSSVQISTLNEKSQCLGNIKPQLKLRSREHYSGKLDKNQGNNRYQSQENLAIINDVIKNLQN